MDYDLGIVGSDVEVVMGPSVRCSEELGVVCFVSHILFWSCTGI